MTFHHAAEVICCRGDGAVVSVKENENHKTQTERGDEVGNESGWDCDSVLAKGSRGRLVCVVVMANASSLRIVLGEVEVSGMLNSFLCVFVEEVSGIEKLTASVCNFCSSYDEVVCVNENVIENEIASG